MKELLEYKLFQIGEYGLSVYSLVLGVLVYVGARILLAFFQRFLKRVAERRNMDKGRQQSIFLLFRYVIWTAAAAVILSMVGFNLTLFVVSSSALLVGVGLGLQRIFLDVASGIFLLFEGTIEVGDILEVDGVVGKVVEIGLRTSKFQNHDGLMMLVPNNKFINEKVVTWTHNASDARFSVPMRVAQTSDVELVKNLMLACAVQNPDVLTEEPGREPAVRLTGFGEQSLNFDLLFYSRNIFGIENTKSALRFSMLDSFRKNNIELGSK